MRVNGAVHFTHLFSVVPNLRAMFDSESPRVTVYMCPILSTWFRKRTVSCVHIC
jgi:hypothetical protein